MNYSKLPLNMCFNRFNDNIHDIHGIRINKNIKVDLMPKPVTKKFLLDRCTFKGQTVLVAFKKDALYAIVKQLTPEDQHAIFKITDREIRPLSEAQVDGLLIYLPSEAQANIDFIDLTKTQKLALIRDNKASLSEVIKKRGFEEQVDLDSKKVIPIEEYSSSLLWNIIKSGKYTFN